MVREFDLRLRDHEFDPRPWASCSHPCASDTKQYNLVLADGQRCSSAGKVTVGLAESNGNLQSGGGLKVCLLYTSDAADE